MLYCFPEKIFIDTAEDLVSQLQRACLLAFEIYYIDLSHIELLWTAGALACEVFVMWHRHSCLCLRYLVFGTWLQAHNCLATSSRLVLPHKPNTDYQVPTTYFFDLPAAAFFAAFNGSSVVDPAKPRRSRGGFFAFRITTYAPLGPGTAPSTSSKLSSLSMPRIFRLRTVTWSTPMWPDIRIPGNTRDGNDDAPIEPCTWNMCPWAPGPPPK